jgi:predicted AAA+ superfamily ATPase
MDAAQNIVARHLQAAVDEALADTPVVCLLGPRQCGKSTLAEHQSADRLYYSLDDLNLLDAARSDPVGFIQQMPGRVTIDEIQRVPELLLTIKRQVDSNRQSGRFLLTGSANLLQMPRLADSLAGRMECLHLHPFTEAEKAEVPGRFLADWLAGKLTPKLQGSSQTQPSSLPERLVAGGYPEPQGRSPQRARQWHRQYLRSIIERDVRDIARVKEGDDVARLLELLSHRTAELLNVTSLAGDLQLDRLTVERYLSILEKLFLIRRLPAWHRNNAKRLVKAPKIYVCDSGLAATLAGLSADAWNTKRDRFGHLLESFVLQQLIAQAGYTDPDLRFWHYRDKDQVEVDCVITHGTKVWGVEVKASATLHPADGHGLRRLAEQAGKHFQAGIVLYDGSSIFSLGDPHLLAVPFELFWKR